jgi:predicted ester cyclase
MAIKGFDPKFRDFPDYILGITHEIWERRRIHTLHGYYAKDVVVRSPASIVTGNENVIAATMATLAEFPDRQLLGEDVIWCGNEQDGFLSSHRILSTATHTGAGAYGPASGRHFQYRVIADCAARENAIYDEWMVRDQGAIARQLGNTPDGFAREQIEREGGPEQCIRPMNVETATAGVYRGLGNEHELGARHADVLARIMNAEVSVVPDAYDRACHLELPGALTAHGHDAADQFWMSLRSSFPSAQFSIEHQIGRTDESMPPRSAIRWVLAGQHDGYGMFGSPTGATVYILGISHAEYGPAGIRRDYTLIDETAIWKQILLHTGGAG